MENEQYTINERINDAMKAFGFRSKRAFADKIGVAQTSFNAILNGAEPKFSTLSKLLNALPDISAEWLMRGEGTMLKKPSEKGINSYGGAGNVVGSNVGGNVTTNGSKDEVISEQKQRIRMYEEGNTNAIQYVIDAFDRFHEIQLKNDEYLQKVLHGSYERNEDNMKRVDRMIDLFAQQNAMINETIKILTSKL